MSVTDVTKPLKIAVVMDPPETFSLRKDSTVAIIRAAQLRGHDVSMVLQEDLYFEHERAHGAFKPFRLTGKFAETLDADDAGADWFEIGNEQRAPLASQDVILMRKDPPFDMEYVYSTYLLERAEQEGVCVVNRPASLRDCNEKFFATAFPDCCPPLVVSRREDILTEFYNAHGNVVFKRLDGMGGKSVFRVMKNDANLRVILETLTNGGTEQIMGQLYLPEIADGDKRILLVDGEAVPYALARIPQAGEARGNLAAGGRGEGRPLTDRDWEIARRVGPELKRRGLTFVGIDVIGDYLTEVNVTCPTCIRELDAQFSLNIGDMLIQSIVEQLSNRA